MRWIAALMGIAVLAGCFDSKLNVCANGAICPETLACTDHTETPCGEEQDVAACRGIADRTACMSSARPVGTCESGVCIDCVPEYVECRFVETHYAAKRLGTEPVQAFEELLPLASQRLAERCDRVNG